jgi:Lipase (class 3)
MTPIITDLECVSLCASIYNDGCAPVVTWDYFDSGTDDEVCWALKKCDGYDVVVFRGSIVLNDWRLDLMAMPVLTRIGTVHRGFHVGMEKMWGELRPMLTQPVMVTGHSLGAARADILCALMVADGMPPARRAVFGEPRPGLADFAKFLKDVPGDGYRNGDAHGHDPVTDVPLTLDGEFDFINPKPLVGVTASPSLIDRIDPLFDYHHIQLYMAALAAKH